jgi:hypothetical protein
MLIKTAPFLFLTGLGKMYIIQSAAVHPETAYTTALPCQPEFIITSSTLEISIRFYRVV